MNSQLEQARHLLGKETESPDRVIALLKPLIATHGESAALHYWFGRAFQKKGDQKTALGLFQKALRLKNDLGALEWEACLEASRCACLLGDHELSESHVKESILKKPDHLESWMHLAELYRARGDLNKALAALGKANKVDPASIEVALQIARVYKDQGHFGKALEMMDVVLEMDEESVEATLQKGEVYKHQARYGEAESCFKSVLELNPGNVNARAGLAELCRDRGELGRARKAYEHLLKDHPDLSQVRANYAFLLQQLGRLSESETEYLEAMNRQPENRTPSSNYLMGVHYNPEHSADKIFDTHLTWAKTYTSGIQPRSFEPPESKQDRPLNVGLLSGGFRQHPVGWMITPALEALSREEFRLFAYSTHTKTDPLTKRIFDCCDQWKSVVGYSEEQIANMIESDEIDILIELSGHAADNRLLTVARKPAPVIIKWVGGLFNTTGMESMDFLISDHYETPVGMDDYYTEKLIRMPDDYIVFQPPEYAPDVTSLPYEENGYITFGCLNNPVKVNDRLLGEWSRILSRVEGSRLLLKGVGYDSAEWGKRIETIMEKKGISTDRILLEGPAKHKEFLETYNRIDIALDTWPYSGGLTTCEAMWMGVPVVTCPGPTFAGRHSATHVINAGFPEWVCSHWDGYVDRSTQLASDPGVLSKLRNRLREQVANSPLCDGERFGKNLSIALHEAWRQWASNQADGRHSWARPIDVRALTEKAESYGPGERSMESTADHEWERVLSEIIRYMKPVTPVQHPFEEPLIVSLTSYPKRFGTLHHTISSLLNQSVRPDRVILWVAEEDRSSVPSKVLQLIRDGLEIRTCQDLGPYKKLIPSLLEFSDAILVTADDDIYYWPTWLQELTECAVKFPDCVIAHRAHRIATTLEGEWLPYGMWDWGFHRPGIPSRDLFSTGGAGVLYRPGCFHEDVTEERLFQKLCPRADDLWFYWMYRLQDVNVVTTGKPNQFLMWPDSQQEALWHDNGTDGNDRQAANLSDVYGWPETGTADDFEQTRSPGVASSLSRSTSEIERLNASMERALLLSNHLNDAKKVRPFRRRCMAQELRRTYAVTYLQQESLDPTSSSHTSFLKRFEELSGVRVRSLDEVLNASLFKPDELKEREITIPGLKSSVLYENARRFMSELPDLSMKAALPVLHGSLADGKTTPYSDVDLTLFADVKSLVDPTEREVFKTLNNQLNRAIQSVDPVGHHGSFVQILPDLDGYPEASMPLDVLESGYSLLDEDKTFRVYTRDSSDLGFRNVVELCQYFWTLPDRELPRDRFMIKRVVSRFFIINLLHYELVTGNFTDKRSILTTGIENVASPHQMETLASLSEIRENWPSDNGNHGGYLSESILRRMAWVAGEIVSDLDQIGVLRRIQERCIT
ncbi:MAG: tetratricopeptide repeat protein [Balneolaceae bacterium]